MKWQNHIGLDIDSSTIKLVSLVHADTGRFKLSGLGIEQSPVFEDQVQWDQSRSQVIKKLVGETKVSTNSTMISLPETQVYTRVIDMPVMGEPDLTTTIRWQAEQYIPVPLTDVVLKHQVLSMPQQGVPGAKMSVLLVAAPNEVLSRYSSILIAAGLEIVAIETEVLAVARAIVDQEQDFPVTLVVHLGAESTAIAVFHGALLVLAQSFGTGGSTIIRSVSGQLGLEAKQAEEYVRIYGLDASKLDGKVEQAVKPVVEMIITEVKRAIAFHQSREGQEPIKRIVLTGGGALLPGLVLHFTESTGLEVQIGDPFAKIDLSDQQRKEIGENGPIFTTAVGLALKPS